MNIDRNTWRSELRPADTPRKGYLSVVIPVFNEEESIPLLYDALEEALRPRDDAYEVICIDDGSSDASLKLLEDIVRRDSRWRVLAFRRNFGQTAAFAAGFEHARGDVIVTLDADLQNDPHDIPELLDKIGEGYDVVSGWRKDRKDRLLDRKIPSLLANRLISRVTDVRLHDYGCSLKAYRRDVLEEIKLYGELHRFVPALAGQVGARICEVPVRHHARKYGTSKYGIGRTLRVLLDLLTVWFLGRYLTRPIQIFGTLGLLKAAIGTVLGGYLVVLKLVYGHDVGGRPLLVLAALLIAVGVQLVVLGLLGELSMRIYHESQEKRIYSIRSIIERDAVDPESGIHGVAPTASSLRTAGIAR